MIVTLPVPPPASVALIVQKPTVVDAVYVIVTWPLASVLFARGGFKVPHEAGTGTLKVNVTRSPATNTPPATVTVAVITELLVPLPTMLEGLAVRVIVFGG